MVVNIMAENFTLESIMHDGDVHHPLGGGSYVWQSGFVEYLNRNVQRNQVRISIGAQPNSSPHLGTCVVFSLGFALAEQLRNRGRDPTIFFEMIDTAPAETTRIDGVEYQRSLRGTKEVEAHVHEFNDLLETLSKFSGVTYTTRRQFDFNAQPVLGRIVNEILEQRKVLGPMLDPENGLLRIRVACPRCGLTDKKGKKNEYLEGRIESHCPTHGKTSTDVMTDSAKLEFNTPVRNLVRALVYASDNEDASVPHEWLRVTGSDYAGYYQEQLLYKAASVLGRNASTLPSIVYAPLITDWSGAKLSKSLYVKKNAYRYLPTFVMGYSALRAEKGIVGVRRLYDETSDWLQNSYKLFRNYSVHYLIKMFEDERKDVEQA